MLKQVFLVRSDPVLTEFSPFHHLYAPLCALRTYLRAVWWSHLELGEGCRLDDIYIYMSIYIVIVIGIPTYHAVYWSYRASRTDRWFLPCSIPWVPGLLEVAHSMSEDQEDQGYRLARLLGQWQLQSFSISNGDGRWPVGPPGVKGPDRAVKQHSNKQKARGPPRAAMQQPSYNASAAPPSLPSPSPPSSHR